MLLELLEGESPAGEKVVDHFDQGVLRARFINEALVDPLVQLREDVPIGFLECLGDKEDSRLTQQPDLLCTLQANLSVDQLPQRWHLSCFEILARQQPDHLGHHEGDSLAGVPYEPNGTLALLRLHPFEDELEHRHVLFPGRTPRLDVGSPLDLVEHAYHSVLKITPISEALY